MSNVQSDSGRTVYECAHPTVLVNPPALREQSISWGAGYPALAVPSCPDCHQPMTVDQDSDDPGAQVETKDQFDAAQVAAQLQANQPGG